MRRPCSFIHDSQSYKSVRKDPVACAHAVATRIRLNCAPYLNLCSFHRRSAGSAASQRRERGLKRPPLVGTEGGMVGRPVSVLGCSLIPPSLINKYVSSTGPTRKSSAPYPLVNNRNLLVRSRKQAATGGWLTVQFNWPVIFTRASFSFRKPSIQRAYSKLDAISLSIFFFCRRTNCLFL